MVDTAGVEMVALAEPLLRLRLSAVMRAGPPRVPLRTPHHGLDTPSEVVDGLSRVTVRGLVAVDLADTRLILPRRLDGEAEATGPPLHRDGETFLTLPRGHDVVRSRLAEERPLARGIQNDGTRRLVI